MSETGGCEVGWLTPVLVAVIGGPLMWFLTRFDRRNTEQHEENKTVLERIEQKVERIDDRLDGHINWHLEREPKPRKRGAA
jgi:cytochrome c-type biogenesis protein CcmH/NrfF